MLRRDSVEFRVEGLELGQTYVSALFCLGGAAAMSSPQYRSSHVIPTWAGAVAWKSKISYAECRAFRRSQSMAASLFYIGRVALRFTAALMLGRPYRARPRQIGHPQLCAAAMSSPIVCSSHVIPAEGMWEDWNLWLRHFFYRQGCAALHRCLDVGSPLQGSASVAMSFPQYRSSHAIPAVGVWASMEIED